MKTTILKLLALVCVMFLCGCVTSSPSTPPPPVPPVVTPPPEHTFVPIPGPAPMTTPASIDRAGVVNQLHQMALFNESMATQIHEDATHFLTRAEAFEQAAQAMASFPAQQP